jgi:beta-phosphoglucomutase
MQLQIKGLIFDLDGVIVDTAKFHFIAWSEVAQRLSIPFSIHDNEQLKGVGRRESLEKILNIGGIEISEKEKEQILNSKNLRYLELVENMNPSELLIGVHTFLSIAKKEGYKIALASASKNAKMILDKTEITSFFDAIVDGNMIENTKPHPEIFLKAADLLYLEEEECIVFEDAYSGTQAAKAAGMYCIGVGTLENLPLADQVISNFEEFNFTKFRKQTSNIQKTII